MTKTWIWIGLVATAAGMLSGHGCAPGETEGGEAAALQMERPGQKVVRSIAFEGNKKLKEKELKQRLGFKVGDYLDEVLAELGRRSIKEHYRTKGFPRTEVEMSLDAPQENQFHVRYRIVEGVRVRVKSVKFVGNKGIKTGALKKVLTTKTRKWGVMASYYNQDTVDADLLKLQSIYADRGYLNHEIRAEGDEHIVFHIEEGPIYHVREVLFEGTDSVREAELKDRLGEGLELEPGKPYWKTKADEHADRLRKMFRERGYIYAEVDQTPWHVMEQGPQANVVDVKYRLAPGEQFRIGRVDVTGNADTQDKVVRHILDEYDFTPGELYNADIAPPSGAGSLEKRIRRQTLAEEARIRPMDSNQPGQKDAQVDVKEGLTGMVMPGVGVSSDSGFIGRLIYQQRNFDITDWPEDFKELISLKSFRGGGQTLRISLEPGTEVSQYSFNYTEPYMQDKPTSFDLSGMSFERYRESYDEGRLKGMVVIEQRLKNKWRPSLGLRGETVEVSSLDRDAPREIRRVSGDNALVGVRLGMTRYLVDDEWEPATGRVYGLAYEQVTGDHNFGLLTGQYAWYHTLATDLADRKTVLATKFLGGMAVGEAPPFERFYGGGTGTYGIRGFKYRGVSPRGLQTNVLAPRIPKRKDPIGSDWIAIASTELAVPVVGDSLSWLLFVDAGWIDSGGIRAGVGTGVQIMIPQWFGPVPMRFSLAVPVMKDGEDKTEVFSFSAGGLF